jgi:uroporphyrinogen-III synthase
MPGQLNGVKIVVPESRELDLVAGLLEAEGAIAIRCPLVQILDLDDARELDAWIEQFISTPFDDLVLLTGEGLRRIARRADELGWKPALIQSLGRVRTIVRGPKPARALRELGLTQGISAPSPTSQGIIDVLADQNLQGRKIGVQLYPGHGGDWLVAKLRERGAAVSPVTPYRYASHAETAEVANTIRRMAAGEFGIIAFTSSPQVERLAEVARECGLEKELSEGLRRMRVAAIGPVIEEALNNVGLQDIIVPAGAFHLKPFVRAIIAAWTKP